MLFNYAIQLITYAMGGRLLNIYRTHQLPTGLV